MASRRLSVIHSMKTTGLGLITALLLINVCYISGWWLIPKCGPQKGGESCWAGCQCGPGLTCEAFVHKCSRPGKSGDRCHATKPCGHGLSCQPVIHRCYHNPRRENEPCVAGHPCGPGLYCKGIYHTCDRKGELGESCNSKNPCKDGLVCSVFGKCVYN